MGHLSLTRSIRFEPHGPAVAQGRCRDISTKQPQRRSFTQSRTSRQFVRRGLSQPTPSDKCREARFRPGNAGYRKLAVTRIAVWRIIMCKMAIRVSPGRGL